MKIKLLLLLLVLASCPACLTQSQEPPKSQVSADPIDADSLAIYRDFLKIHSHNGGGPPLDISISEFTVPYRPANVDRTGCLREFQPSDFGSQTVHRFAADAFQPPVTVVDPEAGKQAVEDAVKSGGPAKAGSVKLLYFFSEIVFDSSHTRAAVSYWSYGCSSCINSGEGVVYEKQNGVWYLAKACGIWN